MAQFSIPDSSKIITGKYYNTGNNIATPIDQSISISISISISEECSDLLF